MEVNSQKMNRVQIESASTSPSIDMENANSDAGNRMPPPASAEK